MGERWNKLFIGTVEILFAFWIVLTGSVVNPLLVDVARHPVILGFFYPFITAIGAVYFATSGVLDSGIITNNGNSKT